MWDRGGLVGRQLELQRLTAALQRAREGTGGILLVSGDAGVGKTRLIAELTRRESDALVLCGVASPVGTAPYGAVVAALRARLRAEPGALDGSGPLLSHLAVILPELGTPAAESDQATLVEAIRGALAHLAREQPVVLVLDDLHWSDEATLELLSALAEPVARAVGARACRLPLGRAAARPRGQAAAPRAAARRPARRARPRAVAARGRGRAARRGAERGARAFAGQLGLRVHAGDRVLRRGAGGGDAGQRRAEAGRPGPRARSAQRGPDPGHRPRRDPRQRLGADRGGEGGGRSCGGCR